MQQRQFRRCRLSPITDLSLADFRAAAAVDWRAAVLHGEVSCVELTSTALTAAATLHRLGAFAELDPEFALARAEQQDATVAALRRRGGSSAAQDLAARAPLTGLPTAFKDLVPVAGLPLRLGTRAVPENVPAADHRLAGRTHRAGAISIGKTQVPEFGLPCYTENQLAEPARNPLDPSRTPGGSTGGGAAAVAAGILPFAPGNDGGGSVRIPAAACGLVGLKPGRGRLPDDGPSTSVRNLVTSGPLASSAEDAALLFDVMAGHRFTPARGRPRSAAQLAEGPAMRRVRQALQDGLGTLSIGVTTESPFSPDLDIVLAEDAVLALEAGISALAAAGHVVQGTDHCTGADPFWPRGYHHNFRALWTSGLADAPFSDEQLEVLEPLTRHFVETARSRGQDHTQAAVGALQEFADSAEEILGPWDVLMTPMLASVPPPVGWFAGLEPEQNYLEQCRFTPYSSVVNVLGLPAVSVPMHTSDDGLSWSVQLIGGHRSEELLLALAGQMMERSPRH